MNSQFKIFCDDSLNALKTLPSNSIDSLVSDPPAGIGFLKLDWDKDKGGRDEWVSWLEKTMSEAYRVLKPGAHGFVWALPRTSHWTALALENSGFQIKDIITHVFGSGFPKSQAIDKMIQNSRRIDLTDVYKVTAWIRSKKKDLGLRNRDLDQYVGVTGSSAHWTARNGSEQAHIPSPKHWVKLKKLLGSPSPEIEALVRNHHEPNKSPQPDEELAGVSKKWEGWGTALKPSSEHWVLIQKPISKQNKAANVLSYGTGALNINASRVHSRDLIPRTKNLDFTVSPFFGAHTKLQNRTLTYKPHPRGRFPANFVLTESDFKNCPAKLLDREAEKPVSHFFKNFRVDHKKPFFYCPKPSTKEKGEFNTHPTVKPLSLMRYLVKMITPPEGIVLDPFMGSGTTGVASLFEEFHFLGIEKSPDYFRIAQRRLLGVQNQKRKNKKASPSQMSKPGLQNSRKLVCQSELTHTKEKKYESTKPK